MGYDNGDELDSGGINIRLSGYGGYANIVKHVWKLYWYYYIFDESEIERGEERY